MANTKRIFLWSGPRNISTTIMYSFAQRQDTCVYDEPLYGYYLSKTSAKEYHPGASSIMESMECEGDKVVNMMLGNHENEVVFFKNMTHHLLDLNRDFLKQGFNIILTRDPKEMLPSFHKVIPNPSMKDVGYADHIALKKYFEKENIPFAILDSTNVLLNPEGVLKQLCGLIGIPFDHNMLSWEKGARKEDGVWAKYWYANIHNSTGYMAYKPKLEAFPESLNKLLKQCEVHYNILRDSAL